MTPFQYFNHIRTEMPRLAERTGHSLLQLYGCFVRYYLRYRIGFGEFQNLHLYQYSPMGLSDILTLEKQERMIRSVNCAPDLADFDNKLRFHRMFSDFIHRDWLWLPEASEKAISAFMDRHELIMLKPTDQCQGKGIRLFSRDTLDRAAFLSEYTGRAFLLEAYIPQHPAMAALNPSSVNTVRILSVRREGMVILPAAALRCGSVGSPVDNFHSGGAAWPVDVETGIVTSAGRSYGSDRKLIYSPSGTQVMPGFQIPHWDILTESVRRAALIPEGVGYIAWDIAVTEDGVEFVECNVGRSGVTILQMNNTGLAKKLQSFLGKK